ncbi:hypothetical protein FSP39_000778 [Pinctada imbricata]|uniref:F-box domain-containing protein n=1 Tax=Pinctada imbricata TaxID=66713 RepID=A0AA89BXS2_PINIB|nr:hypothetical protein FSP39_000778 [Pinctada imbricata]
MAKQGKCISCDKIWLNEHGALVDYGDVANAPSKDFYHVFVTPDQVCFRLWKIVPPTRISKSDPPGPSEIRDSIEEFLEDDQLHSEIQRVAGDVTVDYLKELAHGHIDYLVRLPRNVLIKMVVDNLGLEDINRLRAVNRMFRELCASKDLWERIYRKYSETPITPELEMLALEKGWERLFFTNKLQLQMQLRRMKRHEQQMDTSPPSGGHAFMTQERM